MKIKNILSIVALALSAVVAQSFFHSASAQTPTVSNRPILFVHGYNVFGLPQDCKHDWEKMETALTAKGFSGPKITVGYYGDDTNCDEVTSPHGSVLSKTMDLARDYAWYIYNQFSQNGTSVDIVTHSFGGLLTRYAMYRVAISDPSFPPFLNVSHVTTLAAPYEGYAVLAETCHVVFYNMECYDMFPLSSFIQELNSPPASLPQGVGGTIWSNVGSNADPLDNSDLAVGSRSATSMNIPSERKLVLPWNKFIFHTMYTGSSDVISFVASTFAETSARAAASAKVVKSLPVVKEHANVIAKHAHIVQDVTRLPASQKPAHITPYYENGTQKGVQFTQVLPGGMFDEMGIRDGDVVQGCTPDTINTPSFPIEGLRAHGKGKFKLCIVRNGKKFAHVVSAE